MARTAQSVADEQFVKLALEPVTVSVYDDRFLVLCSEIAMYRIFAAYTHRNVNTYQNRQVGGYGYSLNLGSWYISVRKTPLS